jgi:outer membrane lipoprotein-sorting protein
VAGTALMVAVVDPVEAAPAELAETAVATTAKQTLISVTATRRRKGTMNTIMWLKLKLMAGVGGAALLAGCGQSSAASDGGDKLTAQEIAEKSRAAYAALPSYSDSGTVVSEMAGQINTLHFEIRLQRPNLYRIDWTQEPKGLPSPPSKGVVWSDGSGDYFQSTSAGREKDAKPQKMENLKRALSQAAGPSWSSASSIPEAFFNQDCGDVFVAPVAAGRHPLQKEKDAKVGDVDCYVVSSTMDFSKIADNKGKSGTAATTLWIGKRDFLIHQSRTKYVEKVDSAPPSDQAIDDAIKKSLELQKKPVTPEAIAAMRPQMKAIMKQVQSTLKSGFEAGVVHTQTHKDISTAKKFAPTDFTP